MLSRFFVHGTTFYEITPFVSKVMTADPANIKHVANTANYDKSVLCGLVPSFISPFFVCFIVLFIQIACSNSLRVINEAAKALYGSGVTYGSDEDRDSQKAVIAPWLHKNALDGVLDIFRNKGI